MKGSRSRDREPDRVLARARAVKGKVRRSLLAWYRRRARDLPWRRTDDPYAIWVSEIMLQQTRVAAAIPFYRRFLDAFPTVAALARAPEDRVLKAWEGLGYYTRARNLHRAARLVMDELDGALPETAAAWRALPGVGAYTAAAVASIAHEEAVPAVDGNVRRVLSRLFRIEALLGTPSFEDGVQRAARELVAPRRPGSYNQAVMELGAEICTPRSPECPTCPLRGICQARARNLAPELPRRRARAPVPHHRVVAAVLARGGRWLLGRRPSDAMLGGLWEFPGGKVEPGEAPQEALHRELREELGLEAPACEALVSVDHAYTHFHITLQLFLCPLPTGTPRRGFHTAFKWVFPSQLSRYALPGATRKALEALVKAGRFPPTPLSGSR